MKKGKNRHLHSPPWALLARLQRVARCSRTVVGSHLATPRMLDFKLQLCPTASRPSSRPQSRGNAAGQAALRWLGTNHLRRAEYEIRKKIEGSNLVWRGWYAFRRGLATTVSMWYAA